MNPSPVRCLILACGNTLRGDDGVGPRLAAWAAQRFRSGPALRVIARQQWTPELTEEIASAGAVLFIDCTLDSAPGAVRLAAIQPAPDSAAPATHRLAAPELLALARDLYDSTPRTALLLTIGAESFGPGEELGATVQAALPGLCQVLERAALRLLAGSQPLGSGRRSA